MKFIKLIFVSFFVGGVLALPIVTLANNGDCLDCLSSYTVGSGGRQQTCTLVDHSVSEQRCDYSCAPGAGQEGYIITFCDFDK